MTMQDGLYNPELKKHRISAVVPSDAICLMIQNIIVDEILTENINPLSVNKLAASLKTLPCDAFLLACTELPLIFNETNLGKPCINTTCLLAEKAMVYACA